MKKTFAGICTALFIGLLPFISTNNLFYGSVNLKYFYSIAFLSLLGLYFSYLLITKKHVLILRKRWLLVSIVLTLAVYYLSAATGVFFERSLWSDILRSTGLLFLTYIFVGIFIISELLTEKDWTLVRRAIIYSSSLFAFLTFFGVQGWGFTKTFLSINFRTDGLTLGNSTFAGAFILLGIVITLIEIVRSGKGSRIRKVLFALLGIQIFSPNIFNADVWLGKVSLSQIFHSPFTLVGDARASSITAVFVLLFMAGWFLIKKYVPYTQKKNILRIWSGVWIVGLVLGLGMLFVPGSIVQQQYAKLATEARLIVWNSGFEAFKERLLLGWGPENFRTALDRHFNNNLYLGENIGEIWFDRAHNVVVDTLVTVGGIGALLTLITLSYFFMVVWRASREGILSSPEAVLLTVLVCAHILQLQTSFDVAVTYIIIGLMLGYGLWLERRMVLSHELKKDLEPAPDTISYSQICGGILLISLIVGGISTIGEWNRQRALIKMFESANTTQQIAMMHDALSQVSDFETLRLASSSFLKGLLGQLSTARGNNMEQLIKVGRTQITEFEKYYKTYLERQPDDYRVRMNYAYLLLINATLGENQSLSDAQAIIKDSYRLSPGNPLTPVMEALSYMYGGDFSQSKAKIEEAIALNPRAEFPREVKTHIENQEKTYPTISILKLENL